MDITVSSGAEVKINVADWTSSKRLQKAINLAIKKSGVELSKVDIEQLFSGSKSEMLTSVKSGALDSLLDLVLSVDSDDEVEKALFKCLERCTYNGEKITKDTFEDVEARGDYYEIVIHCLKENLAPFFRPLLSKLKKLAPSVKSENQK